MDAVVQVLSVVFARHELPKEVCTDNGPQLSSNEFKKFAFRYDFQHVTSSPHFPRSNRLAEKGVQIVKRIMKKSTHALEDYKQDLLDYRSAPLEDGRSPSGPLTGRTIRSRLPDFTEQAPKPVHKRQQSSGGVDHFSHYIREEWSVSGERTPGQRQPKSKSGLSLDHIRSSLRVAECYE